MGYSRQRINESWEDICTKMYEYEVHEEIIGEIEAYIDRLKERKLARETAITEGLVPKYEAILKVAREYTKGSDVSAKQLADTINELVWAAHDGNLEKINSRVASALDISISLYIIQSSSGHFYIIKKNTVNPTKEIRCFLSMSYEKDILLFLRMNSNSYITVRF